MDFDGDAMAYVLMLDNYMTDKIEALAPHKNMVDANHPRKLTGVASIPKPVATIINNWLQSKPAELQSLRPEQQALIDEIAAMAELVEE